MELTGALLNYCAMEDLGPTFHLYNMPVPWLMKLRGHPTKYQSGSKALVPLNLGSCILYDKNPDNTNKRPEWSKGVVTDIDGPDRKSTIENDTGKNVTRTR